MRYLSLAEVVHLHRLVIDASGGLAGIRDLGALEAALAQPRATFDGKGLYPSLVEKAVALAYSLVRNHPFVDGNKRIGHAALEVFLVLNGFEIEAEVVEQEELMLALAAGDLSRVDLILWLRQRVRPREGPS
ncbi:MAG: type II toxin-antitoxin system death-on-curing family toxin [Acidobacteria bacterium]|nr:type II toxin-antitoxin system death-on-curing family toxin [Acidobacteriota bacterium]